MRRKVCSLVKNGQKVFTGTYQEIADWLCTSVENVKYGRKKGRLYDRQFLMVDEGWRYEYRHQKKKVEKPKMTKHEATLSYLERHLNEYGKTTTHSDNKPKEFQKELADLGYQTEWILERDDLKDDSTIATVRRGQESYHYTVILLNKVPKKNNHIIQSIKGIW